jgi:hypothetical protein
LSSTPEFNEEQLAAVRAQGWHWSGDALLTLESVREWIGERGLVLFAPRTQQLATPAPSLVEATLGRTASAPTSAEMETARGLVARLTVEGAVLPLNLLGGPGDLPDFVVSAQVFSYVFTLRGDKLWKQPPATSGAMKVSLLAAKVYEALAEGNALTAGELASELGREVTESAILRALIELWAQMRVIPLLQQDGSATMWELTSRRFTKQMKAGGNAGLPTALSALVSLYLAQVYAATEEEIETFLSPLSARSRVRDVLHGLTGARQLETVVLGGKSLLYLPGALPAFPAIAAKERSTEGVEAIAAEPPKKIGTGRIRSFEGGRKPAGEFRGKPERSFTERRSGAGGTRPAARFGAREGKSDRERRPFRRDSPAGGTKPSFRRPWDEERKVRPARPSPAGTPDSFKKFRKPGREDQRSLGDREQAGLPAEKRIFSKPRFERESKARDFAKRSDRPREASGERAFKPRSYGRSDRDRSRGDRGGEDRGNKPGGFGPKRPYKRRDAEGGEGTFAKRPYTPRATEGGERRSSKPRFERGGKPGGFGAKRPYEPRDAESGERSGGSFAKRPYKSRGEGGSKRSEGAAGKSFGAKSFGAKKFGVKPAGRFGSKPGTKFGSKPGKFGAKKFGGKSGGFGAKRGGPAGKAKSAPRKPEVEE